MHIWYIFFPLSAYVSNVLLVTLLCWVVGYCMLLCCFSAMDDKNIEEMLRMLVSGEISGDQLESDGEDLDYYPSRQDLLDKLEESPLETFNGNGKDIDPAIDPINAIDPPAVTDSDPPIVLNISTPESAHYMPSEVYYVENETWSILKIK